MNQIFEISLWFLHSKETKQSQIESTNSKIDRLPDFTFSTHHLQLSDKGIDEPDSEEVIDIDWHEVSY